MVKQSEADYDNPTLRLRAGGEASVVVVNLTGLVSIRAPDCEATLLTNWNPKVSDFQAVARMTDDFFMSRLVWVGVTGRLLGDELRKRFVAVADSVSYSDCCGCSNLINDFDTRGQIALVNVHGVIRINARRG